MTSAVGSVHAKGVSLDLCVERFYEFAVVAAYQYLTLLRAALQSAILPHVVFPDGGNVPASQRCHELFAVSRSAFPVDQAEPCALEEELQ